ncbi:MAG: hypothetical protein CK531_00025 [Gemmatimonadetes bacterium]|nr:MAG: hypothetical protein CK531_00025 [Gemmatimonadota bacterium]
MRPFRLVAVPTLLSLVAVTPSAAQKPLISYAALINIVENHKAAVLRFIDVKPEVMLGFRLRRASARLPNRSNMPTAAMQSSRTRQ